MRIPLRMAAMMLATSGCQGSLPLPLPRLGRAARRSASALASAMGASGGMVGVGAGDCPSA